MTKTSQEYYDWLSKFEAKKTTDDCYTPPGVYDAVIEYVDKEVISLNGLNVVRPFYPGGDYQKDAQSYDDKTIVIDNPPFSIISKICKFYQENNIKFFLFAPALTAFSPIAAIKELTAIIAPQSITYANGANVATSYITNTMPGIRVKTAPTLYKKLIEVEKELKQTRTFPKNRYPANLLMVSDLQKLCRAGIDFELMADQAYFVRRLDEQKKQKEKGLFGGGMLISDDKAKERQAKERQAKERQAKERQADEDVQYWTLSERERAIVEQLGAS